MTSYPSPLSPAEIYPAEVILVQFKHGVTFSQASALNALYCVSVRRQLSIGRPLFVIEPRNCDDFDQLLASYQSHSIVDWAIVN